MIVYYKKGKVYRSFTCCVGDAPLFCACAVLQDFYSGFSNKDRWDSPGWEGKSFATEDEAFMYVLSRTRNASGSIFLGDKTQGSSRPFVNWLAKHKSIAIKDGNYTITYTPAVSCSYINGFHNSRVRHVTILVEKNRNKGDGKKA